MADFGTIRPITLTEERKLELEAIMVDANRALTSAAICLLQCDVTPARMRGIRDAHLKNIGTDKDPVRCLPFTAKAVARLRDVEGEILAGFVRTTHQLCLSFYLVNQSKLPDSDMSDYQLEAEWAIWDAMYAYDGSKRFTTLIYWVVKNRLVNYVRKQSRRAETTSLGSGDPEIVLKTNPELELMRQALEQADLTPIERELIEAHMAGKRGYRAELERSQRINPDNGKPYTRAWLGQIFQVACEKCRKAFDQKAA